jgi:uncharacterized protein (DUF1684 family)
MEAGSCAKLFFMTRIKASARLVCIAVGTLSMMSAACGRAPSPGAQPGAPATAGPAALPSASPAARQTDGAAPPANSYEAEIRKWQQEREATLKSDTGWLTIAGLFFLSQPQTTFGSDPVNDIVLPAGAPARAGTFELHRGKVSVQAAPGVSFQLGGKALTSGELKSDGDGPPDRLSLGDLQLWVHMSGDRPSIRLRDRNSKLRQTFVGTSWFAIDSAYRVDATYQPYDKPKTIQVPNILGDVDTMQAPGLVSFTLNGRQIKMEPVADPGDKEFWFILRDLTSGKETYPAARFLYMPAPVNGKMTVDFNRAENPPCAYNPYATCPLPPEQNRLPVRIEAGEKNYAGHS